MRELAQEVLAGQEAWVVGGAVRDELLGRELIDLDIACREPKTAARAYANRSGGAPFPLSERHGNRVDREVPSARGFLGRQAAFGTRRQQQRAQFVIQRHQPRRRIGHPRHRPPRGARGSR